MIYNIPLFDLNFDEKEEQAVVETLKSKWISAGPKTGDLEEKMANLLNCKFALAVSNCTVALHLALDVTGIGPGDEVILPSLTFVATANAVRYVGATPVFADVISTENITINPEEVERLITPKTKAVIVMHYGGFPCEMDRIIAIAKKHNLKVIEDACHGPLSEYNSSKLGTIGDVGCFSFFSNKNISTGEGGMLVTNDEMYFEKAKLLRSHGMTSMSYERAKGHNTSYDVVALGYNYRMDDIRASIGLVQLDKIQADLELRAEIRKQYIRGLSKNDNLIVPFKNHTSFSSNYIMPIILKDSDYEKRDAFREYLKEKGIQTSVHYPAVHRFSIYKNYYRELPVTDYISDCEVTLPMYSKLEPSQVDYIIQSIGDFF